VSPADATIAEGAKLRSLGINTIPILNAIGHCPVPHSTYRDEGMPSDVFEAIVREKHAHGIQVSCGVGWGLAVVDVDGDLGAAWLGCHSVYHPMPPTVAGRTPRDGWQFWYAIPPDVDSLPSCDLWKGPGDHQGVELLADRKLARCYPSYKTIDGERRPYAWEPGRGPGECPLAYLPRWAIDMARRHARPSAPPVARGYQVTTPRAGLSGDNPRPGPSWREVRDAVSDKLSLAERWGLRIERGGVDHLPLDLPRGPAPVGEDSFDDGCLLGGRSRGSDELLRAGDGVGGVPRLPECGACFGSLRRASEGVVKRPDLPPNPFSPGEDWCPDELRRIYDAIDDINRDYRHGMKSPADSFDRACERAIQAINAVRQGVPVR
jgi:hypothetical protein